MSGMKWFGSKSSVQAGANAFQALFGLRAKTEAAPETLIKDDADFGADIRWTASLYRGPDLPPWRLSILMASDAPSSRQTATQPAKAT